MHNRVVALLLLVGVVLLSGGAGAQKPWENNWEKPKDGWWKALKAGETATFEMTVGEMRTQLVYTIEKVEGTMVTVGARTVLDGMTMPMTSETIDAAERFASAGHSPDTMVKKGGKSAFRAGDATFQVTEYAVQSGDVKIQAWHAPDLPPIFNGGNVKIQLGDEQPMTITLVSYKRGR